MQICVKPGETINCLVSTKNERSNILFQLPALLYRVSRIFFISPARLPPLISRSYSNQPFIPYSKDGGLYVKKTLDFAQFSSFLIFNRIMNKMFLEKKVIFSILIQLVRKAVLNFSKFPPVTHNKCFEVLRILENP